MKLDLDALFEPGPRELERLAADARDRGRGDGGDEPSARDPRRPARARARRERGGCRARGGSDADRRRADRQRRRRRRVRARLGRAACCTGSTAPAGPRPISTAAAAEDDGPRSVTVPGAVRLWADLAERFGRFGLDAAVGSGRRAAAATASSARRGSRTSGRGRRTPRGRRPPSGERYALPELAADPARGSQTEGPDALYEGEVAAAIAAATLALRGRPPRPPLGVGRAAAPRATAGSRSASCRRTARASRRCSRWRSTTGSSRGRTPRSRR